METIKYKYSTGSFVKKIDVATSSTMAEFNPEQSERYAGLIAEMQAWIDAGNEIEPQFTAEELEAKEIKDDRDAAKNKESEIATAKREAAIYLNELQIDSDPDCITKARQQFNDAVLEIESRY